MMNLVMSCSGRMPDRGDLLFCLACRRTYPSGATVCPLDGTLLNPVPLNLPKVGSLLDGRYLVLEKLGQGGMGAIFRSLDLKRETRVALKVLRPELLSRRDSVRRFFAEGRAVKALDHPNIVRVEDFGVSSDGYLYLAMELVAGRTLGRLIQQRGRLASGEAVVVALGVVEALVHAHDQGLVHRDLKPENVLVVPIDDRTFQVKVLDFGIAAALGKAARGFLHTGEVWGTPSYMSPEQIKGGIQDHRSDLYSLGAILFEMLAGHPPFRGDSPVEVMRAHLSLEPPGLPPLPVSSVVGNALERLLRELLAKDPSCRPLDARSVRSALRSIRDNLAMEQMAAVDSLLFSEAVGGATVPGLLHERETVAIDPTAAADGEFHERPTVALPQPEVDDGTAQPGSRSYLAPPEMTDGFQRHQSGRASGLAYWLLESNKVVNLDNREVSVSLMHAEIELPVKRPKGVDPWTLLVPELEAFESRVLGVGGLLCEREEHQVRVVFGAFGDIETPWKTAVMAAVELVERIRRFRQATGVGVGVRIGVATDKVFRRALILDDMAISLKGAKVDLAARLSRMAPLGGVLVDQNTRGRLDGSLKFRHVYTVKVRGSKSNTKLYAVEIHGRA